MKRFLGEVKAVRALKHPNIIRIYDLEKGKAPYYTMEYCPGQTLSAALREGRLDKEQALGIALGIARGLEHAHSMGVIHRDLKPDNILLDQAKEPKIIDFGVAKTEFTQGLTREGELLGTQRYMAPEQERGERIDKRVDIYALGVISVEMGLNERDPLIASMLEQSPEKRPETVARELEEQLKR